MFFGIKKAAAVVIAVLELFTPFSSYLNRENSAITRQTHEVTFEMFDYDESMSVHRAAQTKYLAAVPENTKSSRFVGKLEYSRPEPACLAWNTTVDGNETGLDEYTVYFSTDANMTNAKKYTTTDFEVNIYNVYLDETYYWYVEGKIDGEIYKSEISSFKTDPVAPRNLFVDGITNARDMGGWNCEGGKVKQGLVYRTGRLHNDEGTEITENGISTMLNELKVKTELDLRYDITPREVGVLGEKVKYIILPMDFSDDMMLNETQAGYIRDFFKVLADKNNYPVFFHCSIGTDRTGVCAFLLNGLLGVAEDDLYRDYCFSNCAFIGGSRDGHNITHYIEILSSYSGDTLADRIESYLVSIGVTEKEVDAIRSIMIEK